MAKFIAPECKEVTTPRTIIWCQDVGEGYVDIKAELEDGTCIASIMRITPEGTVLRWKVDPICANRLGLLLNQNSKIAECQAS